MSNFTILSKKATIVKAVFYALLPLAYLTVCNFIHIESVIWLLPISALVAILYTIPHFAMQAKAKSKEVITVKPFIISDLLYALLPSYGVAFFFTVGVYVFADGGDACWLFCCIALATFTLITLYFWLSYYIYGIVYKKIKSRFDK